MEEIKLHNKTHWIYTHFFHFFDIPHFLPYELVKKFLKHWNKYFNSRDELKDAIADKDATLENFNIDDIVDVINNMSSLKENSAESMKDVYSNFNNKLSDLTNSENNFLDVLDNILTDQDSYNWKWGTN